MPGKTILIQPLGFEAPVQKAASELAEYLPKLANVKAAALPPRAGVPGGVKPMIVLGTSEHLGGFGLGVARPGASPGRHGGPEGLATLPRMHALDDAIALVPKGGVLYLAGSNARSVLFAAYRLLEEMGAVFLRPGPEGEVLPKRATLPLPKQPIREKASYRHRGICIEGAPQLEHVLELLDWMAKKKMNSFQLQFRHAGVFWRRGYASPEMDAATRATKLSEEDCLALDDRVIARMQEYGMVLHRVGHGWTSAAAGYGGTDWEQTKAAPRGARKDWLAQVKGRRELWHGVAINTELCYSNAEARRALVEEVVTYAKQHCEVHALHVWMSDSYNNKCECAECRGKTPSDWYAIVVNEIAERLQAEKLPTRIVFLGYVDLVWPPAETTITADNVIFMYAPITRCFQHALDDPKCDEELSRGLPELNKCRLPSTNRMYAEIAQAWKKQKLPDSFLFDYHQMWAVWLDGMGRDIGTVMAQDMKDLRDLGIGGFISCQCVRAFYPLPYMANAMADMLWDRGRQIRAHRRAIMSAGFGKHADEVERYFTRMVRAFKAGGEYEHKSALGDRSPAGRRKLMEMASEAEEARRRFSALARSERGVVRRSLELLAIHAEHVRLIAEARVAGIAKNKSALKSMRGGYEKRLPVILRDYSPWVDPLVSGPVMQAFAAAEKAAAGGPA